MFISSILTGIESEVLKERDKVNSNLGKAVVIGKDTFTIIDFSIINQSYSLSNNTSIAFSLADSILLKAEH